MLGKTKIVAGAVILAGLAAGPAFAEGYAALSYDPDAGAVGMSSHATKAEAEAGATKECRKEGGGKQCEEHFWSHNGCISLIVATKTAYGIGLAGSEDAAKKIATEKCVQTGGSESSCKDHFTACAN